MRRESLAAERRRKTVLSVVLAAICIISAFGIYSLIKTAKTDENTLE